MKRWNWPFIGGVACSTAVVLLGWAVLGWFWMLMIIIAIIGVLVMFGLCVEHDSPGDDDIAPDEWGH